MVHSTINKVLYIMIDNCLSLMQIGYKNQQGVARDPLSKEKAASLVQDVFMAAAERDIYTGDGLRISIITSAGVEEREVLLRRD